MDTSSAGPSASSLGSSSHRPQPSTASTSSYAPVLINPTPDGRLTPPYPHPEQAIQFRLRYPYPLPIASLLDIAYTLHHQYQLFVPSSGDDVERPATALMLTTAAARAVVLLGVVGCSRRWRSRGGWVAAVCGISVGAGIWEDCAERLGGRGGRGGAGGGEGGGEGANGQSWFLYMTILICISEYLLYLLLLRLSPPSHRPHPFSLRAPSAPRQTDVPFAFQSEDLEYTPRSVRLRRGSAARRGEGARRLFPIGPGREDDDGEVEAGPSRLAGWRESEARYEDSAEEENYEHDDFDDHPAHHSQRRRHHHSTSHFSSFTNPSDEASETSSTSSVSNSSIIDLPPPLSPNRIIPPSLSVNSGLTLAMTGAQPILGGIVRRSASSRFLGRSWGSGVVLGSPTGESREGRLMGPGKGKGRGAGSESRERNGGRGGEEEGREGGYGTFHA